MAASPFVQELVRIVEEQFGLFGGLDEGSTALSKQIRRYWEETGHGFPASGVEEPWSAVFVSWCIKKAGASKEEFSFNPSHSVYVREAIKNADRGIGVFRAFPIDKERVAVGDLIHENRNDNHGNPGTKTYDGAREPGGYNSHCDFVVALDDDVATVIGGNVGDTRAQKTVRLTQDGFVKQRAVNPYISIVKNLKGLVTSSDQEDDLMATVIKIKEPNEPGLWLYAAGQRRRVRDPAEIPELKACGLLDNRPTTELSRRAFEAIPIMPGGA